MKMQKDWQRMAFIVSATQSHSWRQQCLIHDVDKWLKFTVLRFRWHGIIVRIHACIRIDINTSCIHFFFHYHTQLYKLLNKMLQVKMMMLIFLMMCKATYNLFHNLILPLYWRVVSLSNASLLLVLPGKPTMLLRKLWMFPLFFLVGIWTLLVSSLPQRMIIISFLLQ